MQIGKLKFILFATHRPTRKAKIVLIRNTQKNHPKQISISSSLKPSHNVNYDKVIFGKLICVGQMKQKKIFGFKFDFVYFRWQKEEGNFYLGKLST